VPIADFLPARAAAAAGAVPEMVTPRVPHREEEEEPEPEDKEAGGGIKPSDMLIMFQSMMQAMGKNQAEMLQFFGEKMTEVKEPREDEYRSSKCPLSTGEIEGLEGDLEPKSIFAWWNEFSAGVKGKIANLEDLMGLPANEKEAGGPIWSAIQADEKMKKADLQLAQAIMPCLKKGAGNVEAFKRRVRRDPKILESGFLLRNKILARAGYRDPEEEDKAVQRFKEKAYYTAGMEAAKVEEATETLEDDLAALPSLLHEPDAQLQWMLRKMPVGASKDIADEHKTLRRELRRGQITGRAPWDTELLSRLIGCAISDGGEEASAAEKGGGKGKGGQQGGQQGAKRGCTNCGSPGHRWFENQCKNGPCSDCGLGFCSKVHGKQIAHVNKSIHMHIASSAEAEAFATGKAGELVEMAHEAARGLGIDIGGPTFVGTDNKANAMVGSGHALPSRMRHCLRRYRTFTERVARREVALGFVPDPENPSDVMSKWTSADKLERSLAFAMNKRNAPRHPRDGRGRGDD
jgi:hypothetical protein